MDVKKLLIELAILATIEALVIKSENEILASDLDREGNLTNVFDGVYTECFLRLSYSCVQEKTLLYLKELGKLQEVSVIGDYVKFVKLNSSENDDTAIKDDTQGKTSEDLSFMIDKAVDKFFNNHVIKFSALGRDIAVPNAGEEFIGRKKRKGGGGGHGGGHDDGGKKKMMMMAMMCMKMKFMMMVPAMMGMMGMMSFKGMMFSMMSFMISKMMLLMKLLEKKGGGAASGGGAGDGGWAASGGGGGAWMPAGGDYGGGGGYDANGQWQSRSIFEEVQKPITYVAPKKKFSKFVIKETETKSRRRRSIIDVIQSAYEYWMDRLLGNNIRRKTKQPNYKVVNGMKYVYYPMKVIQKPKTPKEMQNLAVKNAEYKPIVIAEDFNKGEIIEGPVQSRMHSHKLNKMKDDLNNTMDDNPWE